MKFFLIPFIIISLLSSCNKDEVVIRKITDQKILVIGKDKKILEFGDVIVDTSMKTQLAITNSKISDLPLTISEISLPKGYVSDWSTAKLNPGESRNLLVTFTPVDLNQDYSGVLKIISDRTAGAAELRVLGTAKLKSIIISLTGNLNFDKILVAETVSKEITIANTGLAPLVVTEIKLPNTTDFSVDWNGGTIQPNSSQTVTLTFNPQSEGDINGTLEVISNATNSENTLAVSGSVDSNIFTDPRDNKQYPLVNINGTMWMKANLAYNEGTGSIDGGGAEGRFYTITQAKAAVPDGWHIASDDEWKAVEQFLGLESSLLEVVCQDRKSATVAQRLLVGGNSLEINYSGVSYDSNVVLQGTIITFWTSTSGESIQAPPGYFFIRTFESATPTNIQRCAEPGDGGGLLLYSVRLVRD